MDQQAFIDKTPYLYHLTDRRNVPFILEQGRLLSTSALATMAAMEEAEAATFLETRRSGHEWVEVNGRKVYIRDQRPLNAALDKCLTDGWKREQFIYHLNRRVFTWPNLHRLGIHFGRYEEEQPVILRLDTAAVLALNPHVEVARINSGATRPSGRLNGKAAARGKDTFLPLEEYPGQPRSVVEVTFPEYCILPELVQRGNRPEGPWRAV